MTESTAANPQHTRDKSEKIHRYLGMVSTGFGICGAVGTLFVVAASTFYVGDVEVRPDKPVQSIEVRAYDNKGHEAIYHTPRFQLMPGSYHLAVKVNENKAQHLDTTVQFNQKTEVPIVVTDESVTEQIQEPPVAKKKHWWQFWR